MAMLREVDVLQIKRLLKEPESNVESIAATFGVDTGTIDKIKAEKIFKHVA